NFIRILEIFDHHFINLKKVVSSCSITDAETKQTLKAVYQQKKYLLDPHGAVGYFALQQYQQANPGQKGIVVETAHPVKFFDVVEPITGEPVLIPPTVQAQLLLQKKSTKIAADAGMLKQFLLAL
ncbi:MAG: threonine synthase, partial [Ferruginibacter sp.]|nr:threonine synthase [Ferruginibacter sp.]